MTSQTENSFQTRVIPCVDIQSGRAVRLFEGDPDRETIYFESPLEAALHWQTLGAPLLHLVDLDAATGRGQNRDIIAQICTRASIPVEVGGGIRDFASAQTLLEGGASRVVIGTAAVKTPELVSVLLERYGPEKVVVSLDAREGYVAVSGWARGSSVTTERMTLEMTARGLKTLIFTDVTRDGTLRGLDAELMARVRDLWKGELIVGGGVAGVQDVRLLEGLNIEGAIAGRALYEGTLPYPVPLA